MKKIILGFMVFILCILFFTLGYAYAVNSEVNKANVFIKAFIDEYPCPLITGGGYDGFSNINLTQYT